MYLEQTAHSSSDTGSTTEPSCGGGVWMLPPVSNARRPGGAGRIRGTAWYRRRLGPDITITSPLCMSMAVGGSCLRGPPRRKMAD